MEKKRGRRGEVAAAEEGEKARVSEIGERGGPLATFIGGERWWRGMAG